jgi:hypothetical protein
VDHEQFKVIAGIENKEVVYYAFFCGVFQILLGDIEKWFGNNVVSREGTNVTFYQ